MSEQFVEHPDAVGDETGALDSEPSLVMDEDRLGEDPLEEGMDPAEDYSRQVKLGGTQASEEQDTLAYRIPQEEPDRAVEEADADPGRPIAATPIDDLDESVDAPEHSVDGVGGTRDAAMEDPLSPDGGTEAELEGEVELGVSSAEGSVEPTGLPTDDGVGETAPVDGEAATEGAEQGALRVEQES